MGRVRGPTGPEVFLWLRLSGGGDRASGQCQRLASLSCSAVTKSGPVSPASLETALLPSSLRFDFTAPRAGGSWQGKLFSNNGFKKQLEEKPLSARALADQQSGGKAEGLAGRSRGTGTMNEGWGSGFSPSSASHHLALWPWEGALASRTYSFFSVPWSWWATEDPRRMWHLSPIQA